ncbi:argininosuccinate lyase [Alloacidobacterium sp.]|uniref:argininosuccinate lyase n=1 Tax=Alloacidobacterium sp. TaxID=2951999 RepID=UPI002D44FED1|nr:argininosuccinate lyase [Alloacidobacterium sp.]HYK36734.1 argininosuccinate lyase [Alloacidobacterium sp.]
MSEPLGKMWSGRFREPLDVAFEAWQRSFPFDWRLLPQEIAASKAHARMIAAAGILTENELAVMLRGLDAVISSEMDRAAKGHGRAAPAMVASSPAEDVHHFVELELTQQIGELALKLHTGRSRNEQIATDMRLFVRDAIDATLNKLQAWMKALIDQARKAGDAAMPSYTHLQRAEPVLVAHWLLAYVSMIERDYSRFVDARKRLNLCPLGSGAVAGATLALDRRIAADVLGFDGPTPNSMDATSDRDFALEFTQAASVLGIHISRFAEELTLYSTAEFGFLDLPETFSTGSSAMPQKKNPDLTELARGKSGRLLGSVVTLSTLIKGLPLAYNKDLQEGQEPVFDTVDTLDGILQVLPGFTAALRFRFDRMQAAAESGFLNAMAAATYLVHKGVPFRKAHEKVGNAVRYCVDKGCELGDLTLDELKQFGAEFEDDFFADVTLKATLDCHDVIGGTAMRQVKVALAAAKERLAALSGAVHAGA